MSLFVTRVSGLSPSLMLSFSSQLGDASSRLDDLESDFDAQRDAFVDSIYAVIPTAAPELRSFLIAFKRDLHNKRRLDRYLDLAPWATIVRALGEKSVRLRDSYEQLCCLSAEFTHAFTSHEQAETRALLSLKQDPDFARGMALASSLVSREIDKVLDRGCHEQQLSPRLRSTLLRYASRAALKLSPFSSFTPVAVSQTDTLQQGICVSPGSLRQRRLVRTRRNVLDKCIGALKAYAPWRALLRVAINSSAEEEPSGQWMFLRPGANRLDPASGLLTYERDAIVRFHPAASIWSVCKLILSRANTVTYTHLIATLAETLDADPQQVRAQTETMIDAGLLQLLPPWSDDSAHLELELLCHAQTFHDAGVVTFASALQRVVTLETSNTSAEDAADSWDQLDHALQQLVACAHSLATGASQSPHPVTSMRGEIYEDAWRETERASHLLTIQESGLSNAMESLAPLVAYSAVFDPRIDFLCSLGHLLREQSGGTTISLLKGFAVARPLWSDFLRWNGDVPESSEQRMQGFNPYALPQLDELRVIRERLQSSFRRLGEDSHDDVRIDPLKLGALVDSVPSWCRLVNPGVCAFLQPLSSSGDLWVQNGMKEGIGRMGSRFTPVMSHSVRAEYLDDLIGNSEFRHDGEQLQVLDIHGAFGDTLNVHERQTNKVLLLPGYHLEIAREHLLAIKDLVIDPRADGMPVIRDVQGQRYCPAHLGLAMQKFLPTFVKFLCCFGPSELTVDLPPQSGQEQGGVIVKRRMTLGNVVVRRKSWKLSGTSLEPVFQAGDAIAQFRRLRHFALHCRFRSKYSSAKKSSILCEAFTASLSMWTLVHPASFYFSSRLHKKAPIRLSLSRCFLPSQATSRTNMVNHGRLKYWRIARMSGALAADPNFP